LRLPNWGSAPVLLPVRAHSKLILINMKIQELREMSVEELKKRGNELRTEALNLRVQKAAGPLENPMRNRNIRKEVARIETILTERRNKAVTA